MIRIEKFIADTTGLSRSEIKKIISKKLIKVNDKIIEKPIKIDVLADYVEYNNEQLKYEKYQYFMFNKPAGYVCANYDKNDPTIFDLINLDREKYFSYGRLDKDTEGILIISNDGELCHKLLNPKHHVPKKYFVQVDKKFTEEFKTTHPDIKIEDDIISKYDYEFIDDKHCFLTIYEGKFHQVKKMLGMFGYSVLYLKRVKFGNLSLDSKMKLGDIKKLNAEELAILKNEAK
ncbi:pseudouridine synthase [Mycoplasmopsis felifaucium]|uniref:pseudouridine synthase n=1 Tax=Mycoplasmopsis felifaucium TaxID=35768 RepID=UPI001F16C24A|nr:pseudouridine synthase [Mycoplasmopsis felifaucium]